MVNICSNVASMFDYKIPQKKEVLDEKKFEQKGWKKE